MAIMYPQELNENLVKSNAEIKLFEKFRKQLSDDFYVFHSVSWTGNYNVTRECDFVIFNRKYGYATLEVKGGVIDYIYGQWYSTSDRGVRYRIKDPVNQAENAKRSFLNMYKSATHERFKGVYTWGICFPDCLVSEENISYHKNLTKFNVLDGHDLDNLQQWVIKLFVNSGWVKRKVNISDQKAKKFINIINPVVHLPLSIDALINNQKEDMKNLNTFQNYILDLFDDKDKVGFKGATGTGKTALAIKKTIRLLEKGDSVLFLCYSNGLANHIKSIIGEDKSLEVTTFHSFAIKILTNYLYDNQNTELQNLMIDFKDKSLLKQKLRKKFSKHQVHSFVYLFKLMEPNTIYDEIVEYYFSISNKTKEIINVLIPRYSSKKLCLNHLKEEYFTDRLPKALSKILKPETYDFDAIIIDEGQDFKDEWCDIINLFFNERNKKQIYIFYDTNRLSKDRLPISSLIEKNKLDDRMFFLKNNLRNTKQIIEYAYKRCGFGYFEQYYGIEGLPPEEYNVNTENDMKKILIHIYEKLTKINNIDSNKITVLSNRSLEDSVFHNKRGVKNYRLIPRGKKSLQARDIKFWTVNSFKGLETEIGIILLHNRKEDEEFIDKDLMYTAFTRVKYMLYVIELKD